MLNAYNNIAPELLNEIFKIRFVMYKLNIPNCSERQPVYSVLNDTETLSHLGPKIWELSANETQQLDSLKSFRLKMKK